MSAAMLTAATRCRSTRHYPPRSRKDGGGATLQGWWAVSYVLLWLLVVMLCVIVVALARQIGTLHLRLGPRGALEIDSEGPPLGEPLPFVDARGADGASLVLGGPGRRRLVLFSSPTCIVCREVAPAVPAAAGAADLLPQIVHDHDAES